MLYSAVFDRLDYIFASLIRRLISSHGVFEFIEPIAEFHCGY